MSSAPGSSGTWLVRLAVRLLPEPLRRDYADEMMAVFVEHRQRLAIERGRVAAHLYILRTVFNLCLEAALANVSASSLSTLLQRGWRDDLRYVGRTLRRSPGYTISVIGILGVGLGMTPAVFSIVYGVLLRPFPYRSPESLVRIDWLLPSGQTQASTLRELQVWRDGARTLAHIGAYSSSTMDIRDDGPAETVLATYTSSDTLAMLGANPIAGRLFDGREDVPMGDVDKAILSYELWSRMFHRRTDIIGRVMTQGDGTLEVIGIMPPGFGFPHRTDLWVPIESMWARSARAATMRLNSRTYSILARLTDNHAVTATRHELQAMATAATPDRMDASLRIRTLREAETGQLRPYLWALMSGVLCLALICITNVASLQLARGTARARELAVRAAIGASAGRNLRLQFLETLALAAFGSVVAAAMAYAALRLLLASIPVALPTWMRLEIDPLALGLSLTFAAAAAVVVGLISSWPAGGSRSQLLLRSARGTTDRAVVRKVLVVGQITLSTVLLLTACLLIQTLLELQRREPGFHPEGILAIQVSRAHVGTPDARARALPLLHRQVLDRLATVPGVMQVAATNRLPLTAGAGSRMSTTLHVSGARGGEAARASFFGSADVTPSYFTTMGIPLSRGRTFSDHDDVESQRVVIVNERAARHLWPDQDPVGQQVTWGVPRSDNPPATVIGVVGNVRAFVAEGDTGLDFYYPYAQYPVNNLFYVLRTSVDPESLVQTVRQLVQTVEPTIAVSTIKTMPRLIEESVWQTRLWGWLFGLFAVTALLLAAAGVYGLVSYLVSLRAKEMSIRLSLGATGEQIVRLVLGGMFRLVAIGVAAGLVLSLVTARLLSTLLFQVSATDVRFYCIASLIVMTVTLAACWPPIVRSRRLDLSALFSGD